MRKFIAYQFTDTVSTWVAPDVDSFQLQSVWVPWGGPLPISTTPPLPVQPLQIKSVVAPEHVKGYIYVEAYKQTHVKQAIEGVGNLRMGYWNQQMVPIKEMTDVLKVVKEVTNLKPKSWVRLKRGIYKDDIAQVRAAGAAWLGDVGEGDIAGTNKT